MDTDQIAAIRTYKKNGGKIYTIGSSRELRELADVQSPASMLDETQNEPGRQELLAKINELSGEQVITIPGTNYVAANVVKKTNSERVILHFVNYHTPIKNVRVSVNLDGVVRQIDSKRIQLFSPDGAAAKIEAASVHGTRVEFVLPELDVYDVVAIN
jgi:GTP-binding protein EngB required for normal cell division